MAQVKRSMQHAMILFIQLYRLCFRPYLPPSCRFYPSCSEYAMESIKIFGAWKGGLYAFKRLLRCHPWSEGGVDPVPVSKLKENI